MSCPIKSEFAIQILSIILPICSSLFTVIDDDLTQHSTSRSTRSTVGINRFKHRQFKIMTCADLAGLLLWSLVTWLNTLLAHSLTHATRGCLRGLLASVPHSYAFTSIQERLPTLGSILEAEDERSYAAASAQPHPEPIPQIWYPVLCILSLLTFSLSTQ